MPTVNNPYVNPVDLANTAPKYHASQHSKGGFDPLTPADIGAAPADHSHDTPGTISWQNVTDKPATFSPSVHAATHGSDGGDPIALDASQIASGVVPLERLPHGCLERLVIVADDEARFALTTAQVQQGDTVKVESTQMMYFVVDESKLNSPDGYVAYTAGAASAVDWSAVTGKPETYPPSAHTHTAAQITDFDSAVDARLSALGISAANMLPAGYSKQEATVNFRGWSNNTTVTDPKYFVVVAVNGYLKSAVSFTVGYNSSTGGASGRYLDVYNGWDKLYHMIGGDGSRTSTVTIPAGTYVSTIAAEVCTKGARDGVSIGAFNAAVIRLVSSSGA